MAKKKKAFITGITGQDGAHLSKHLLDKGIQVFGGFRRGSYHKTWRLDELNLTKNLTLVEAQLSEPMNLLNILTDIKPDYIFHLAGVSYISDSFKYPVSAIEANTIGTINLLEAAKSVCRDAKIFFASSSEIFGNCSNKTILDENSHADPMNPYGASKLAATQIIKIYRTRYNMACYSGILFNHEGPFRSRQFVTRKITFNLARLKQFGGMPIELGNLNATRDWGLADNYTLGMLMLLNSDKSEDMVFATGKLNSVREFLKLASETVGFYPEFDGEGISEVCYDRKTGNKIAVVSEKYYRPYDSEGLTGNPKKIESLLSFKQRNELQKIVIKMVEADLKRVGEGRVDV